MILRFALLSLLLLGCIPSGFPRPGTGTPTPGPRPDPPANGSTPSPIASALVQLTNAERARAGLPALAPEARLMRAAQIQADQAAATRSIEHVLPGTAYPRPQDRLAAVGYDWRAFAENLAMGAPSAAATLEDWMDSPGHRANILSADYTELGTAHAVDAAGRPYYVQVFGRPAH